MYRVGDRIKFKSEKKTYKIMACDSRYLICVKPFNLKNTFMYCYVDLAEQMRGPENKVFGTDYDMFDTDDCNLALKDLQTGKIDLSPRRSMKLEIE
jgi:hypothetical protein